MLDLTDDVGPPDYLPVLLRVQGFLVQPLFEVLQQVGRVGLGNQTQQLVLVDDLCAFLQDLSLALQLFRFRGDVRLLKHVSRL